MGKFVATKGLKSSMQISQVRVGVSNEELVAGEGSLSGGRIVKNKGAEFLVRGRARAGT